MKYIPSFEKNPPVISVNIYYAEDQEMQMFKMLGSLEECQYNINTALDGCIDFKINVVPVSSAHAAVTVFEKYPNDVDIFLSDNEMKPQRGENSFRFEVLFDQYYTSYENLGIPKDFGPGIDLSQSPGLDKGTGVDLLNYVKKSDRAPTVFILHSTDEVNNMPEENGNCGRVEFHKKSSLLYGDKTLTQHMAEWLTTCLDANKDIPNEARENLLQAFNTLINPVIQEDDRPGTPPTPSSVHSDLSPP